MLRQTFYISDDVSKALRQQALLQKMKMSVLVDKALRRFLEQPKENKKKIHSLLKGVGKIDSFKGIDPIQYQKKLRSEWDDG